jgi:hypothetical protein
MSKKEYKIENIKSTLKSLTENKKQLTNETKDKTKDEMEKKMKLEDTLDKSKLTSEVAAFEASKVKSKQTSLVKQLA